MAKAKVIPRTASWTSAWSERVRLSTHPAHSAIQLVIVIRDREIFQEDFNFITKNFLLNATDSCLNCMFIKLNDFQCGKILSSMF